MYCLKCRKKSKSKNPRFVKKEKRRMIHLSIRAVCDSKKSRFIKELEASGLLSRIGIKIPLSKIPLLSDILSSSIKLM